MLINKYIIYHTDIAITLKLTIYLPIMNDIYIYIYINHMEIHIFGAPPRVARDSFE